MENPFDEIRKAVDIATEQIRAVDNISVSIARLLRGRLKFVPPYILIDLKKELTKFDAHKKEWKK